MNLWQAFKMAFKSIAMKKGRSFLTMLGIIIGVASVVIMVSVVQGTTRSQSRPTPGMTRTTKPGRSSMTTVCPSVTWWMALPRM